jgi:hypothetical protein
MPAIPAEHVAGGTALAVTVIGVGTELPLAGLVRVIIPLEVDARATQAQSSMNKILPVFIVTPKPGHSARIAWNIPPREVSRYIFRALAANCIARASRGRVLPLFPCLSALGLSQSLEIANKSHILVKVTADQ